MFQMLLEEESDHYCLYSKSDHYCLYRDSNQLVMFQMLLLEESDHYCLYSDSEKEEFLFHLFQHLCLGGQVCQYEDMVDPYLNITKQMYKDLIR